MKILFSNGSQIFRCAMSTVNHRFRIRFSVHEEKEQKR